MSVNDLHLRHALGVSPKELARRIGVSTKCVQHWCSTGMPCGVLWGRGKQRCEYIINLQDVRRWVGIYAPWGSMGRLDVSFRPLIMR